jgi:uncharacterized protein (DUF58 family)
LAAKTIWIDGLYMHKFLFVIIILILIAGLLRADKVLVVLYLIMILYLVGRWWSRRAIHNVVLKREFTNHAFLEQIVPVSLNLSNTGILPVVWLQVHERLPIEMVVPGHYNQIVSLGSRQSIKLDYSLQPHKRGLYKIGPALLTSGDLLGMDREEQIEIPTDTLTVYPRIVALEELGLPSRSMFGSIRDQNPAYEDPSRIFGKRNFINGDSLRKVDWKASASTGMLQVKLFEASKSLNLLIYLDLNIDSYDFIHHYDQTELAIVAAASIANWAVKQKHGVGLVTNGSDPIMIDPPSSTVTIRKGNAQLMSILETLARIRSGNVEELHSMLNRIGVGQPWGTTLLIITGKLPDILLNEMIRARRRGLNIALMNIGTYPGLLESQHRARQSGFCIYQLHSQIDLDHLSKKHVQGIP